MIFFGLPRGRSADCRKFRRVMLSQNRLGLPSIVSMLRLLLALGSVANRCVVTGWRENNPCYPAVNSGMGRPPWGKIGNGLSLSHGRLSG